MAEIRTVELNVETNALSVEQQFEKLRQEIAATEEQIQELNGTVGVNNTEFEQAQQKLKELKASYDTLSASATDTNATFQQTYGELQPLTTRMGEAEDRLYELALAGQTATQEYKDLLATVQQYRSTQMQVDMQVDAASVPIAQKLTSVVGGVAGGFAAAEGAIAMFGVESKDMQETMVKLNAAVALTSGIASVHAAIPAFKAMGAAAKASAAGVAVLGAVTSAYSAIVGGATGAMKVFKIALISTGVGALVVGLGMVIANFEKIISVFTPVINGFKMFSDWIGITNFKQKEADAIALRAANNRIAEIKKEKEMREKLRDMKQRSYDAEDKAMDRQIKLLKAQGKDTTDLERQRLKASIRYQTSLQNETYALWVQNREKNRLILSELKAIAIREQKWGEYNEKFNEFLNSQNELARENAAANQARLDAVNDLAVFEAETLRARNEAQTQSVQTTQTTEKQKYDLEKENRDKRIALMADGYEKEKAIIEARSKDAKDDLEKRNKEGIIKGSQFAEAQKLIQQTLDKDLAELDRKYNKEKALTWEEKNKKEIQQRQIEFDAEMEAAAKRIELREAEAAKKKEIEEEEKKTAEETAKAKVQIALDSLQLISNITELFGRQNEKAARRAFQVDKAAKLASATIAGIEGTIEAYKTAQKSAITTVFPAYPYIQAGLAGAFAAVNIAKISQSKFGGSTSTTSPSGGGAAAGGASMTAQFNTIGTSGINQLATLQQQPVQAYVVSGEVTSAQALDRNRVQNATL
jgi:hypothetical protein